MNSKLIQKLFVIFQKIYNQFSYLENTRILRNQLLIKLVNTFAQIVEHNFDL